MGGGLLLQLVLLLARENEVAALFASSVYFGLFILVLTKNLYQIPTL
ncbi:hypothetical protein CCACVL1_03474 [Corchorus capsularis]|uniref:Uncharacterized protein n=1 Tax=Corchorus capsularis TaxID=210143 RepID=A0A1R3JYZ8_COCAP|nr:hypothetical protein CCACVL1_03474 [Corchorus capsularis]